MKDRYYFPAIFTIEEKAIGIEFPDLPGCTSCSYTVEEAFKDAKAALSLHLYGMEEDKDPIPDPSKITDIKLQEGQFVGMIEVWMVPYRDEMQNKAVKKTLTIPKWLDDIAEERNVNFSHVLQDALKEYLGIENNKGQ